MADIPPENLKNFGHENIKKKILFLVTQSEFGGAQRFLFNLVKKLDKDRYEILVATGKDGGGEFLKVLAEIGTKTKEIKNLKRETSPSSDLKAVPEIRKVIREFKPDVLFLNSSKAGFVGSLAAKYPTRFKNLKVVYRIGGWTFNDPWPDWKKRLWKFLEKFSAHWKDIIIVNNLNDLEQAEHLKIRPKDKLALVYNGLDMYKMEYLSKEEARLRIFEKISRNSGKIFQAKTLIGTIANFYPAKGLKYLIEAARHFKGREDIVFILIGDGAERPELESTIKEKGLEKNFFLLGKISEAYKLIPAFDIFVLPSVKEGFSWSLIEAMGAKVPVISTNVGAAPEIIENGKNGFLVEPENSEQIAKNIKEILSNSRLEQELGIQGHQTVLFKFDMDKMVSQVESLF